MIKRKAEKYYDFLNGSPSKRKTSFLYNLYKKGLTNLTDMEESVSESEAKTFGDWADKLITGLNIFYKDQWDFLYYQDGGQFKIDIIIKYPDVTISNERDDSHVIKGLYIVLNISSTSDFFILDNLRVMRDTYRIEEVMSQYRHSHVRKTHTSRKFTTNNMELLLVPASYCKGDGTALEEVMTEIAFGHIKVENYDILYFLFEDALTWESVEGGAYVYMNKIRIPSPTLNSYSDSVHFSETIVTEILHSRGLIKAYVGEDRSLFAELDPSILKLKKVILEYCRIYNSSKNDFFYEVVDNNKTAISSSNSIVWDYKNAYTKELPSFEKEGLYFYFRGVKVTPTVLFSKDVLIEESKPKINLLADDVYLKNRVISNLDSHIKKTFLNSQIKHKIRELN